MAVKKNTKPVVKKAARPNAEQVKGLLLEGNFGSGEGNALPITDPITTSQMVLTLAEIKPYDKNPRRELNSAYDEIKASIRSKKQLNNNFNVTRRPGDDMFMIESGGNTRLAILNELYLETADEAFNTVHCLFVPWKSESSILTAHLIENEMRGDMILIDKAYAVKELRYELEAEQGNAISDREFVRLALDGGYKISTRHLSRFNYAIKLDQMIPQVLRKGLGGNKLDYIKKVEKAYQQLCQNQEALFDATFMNVMSESDTTENWDFDQVRNELGQQLERIVEMRANLIYMKVNQILENNPRQTLESEADPLEPDIIPEVSALENVTETTDTQQPFDQNEMSDDEAISFIQLNDQDKQDAANQSKSASTEKNNTNQSAVENSNNPPLEQPKIKPKENTNHPHQKEGVDLKRLLEKNFDLACKIARSSELEASVMQSKSGLGFFMETPVYQLVGNHEGYYCWWLLFSLSEQASSDSHFSMWEFSDLYDRLGKKQHKIEEDSLDDYIGVAPTTNQLLYEMLHNQNNLSDIQFTDIFRLMENTRKIRTSFSESELWEIK